MRLESIFPPAGIELEAMSLAWSPGGELLATGGRRPGPSVWSVEAARRVSSIAHPSFCYPVIWDSSGRFLFAGTGDGEVLKIDYQAERIVATARAFGDAVRDVSLSPSGEYLAIGSQQGQLWIGRTADLAQVSSWQAHGNPIMSVCWSPSARWVTSSAFDSQVKFWELDGNLAGALNYHRGPVGRISYSSDGRLVGTASADGTIRLWDLAEKRQAWILDEFGGRGVADFAFLPGDQHIVSLADGLAVWRIQDGALLHREEVPFMSQKLALHPSDLVIGCAGLSSCVVWRILDFGDESTPAPTQRVADALPSVAPKRPEEMSPAELFALATTMVLVSPGDLSAAQPHLEAAASAGHVEAMAFAGKVAEELEQTQRAEDWYTKAADHGNQSATFALARFSINRGDKTKAENLLARFPGHIEGDYSGYSLLASLAEERADLAAASGWESQGVAAEDPASLVRHGSTVYEAHRDRQEALQFFLRGAELGHTHGMYLAAVILVDLGRRNEALEWLKTATGAGHKQAAVYLRELTA